MPAPVFNITTDNMQVTQNAGTPLVMSKAFGSANVAGRGLLVIYAYDTENISIIRVPSISDTSGNTYTRVFGLEKGVNTGPGLTCFFCPSAIGGANTVTCSSATDWIGFGSHSAVWQAYIILLALPPGLSFVSSNDMQIDGPSSDTLATTLHDGSTITLTYTLTGFSSYAAFILFDVWDGKNDYMYTAGIVSVGAGAGSPGSDTFTSSPSGFSPAFLIALTDIALSGGGNQYLALYQCGPGPNAFHGYVYIIN
jgi:hypothetical protein